MSTKSPQTAIANPDGYTIRFEYDDLGSPTRAFDEHGYAVSTDYDNGVCLWERQINHPDHQLVVAVLLQHPGRIDLPLRLF